MDACRISPDQIRNKDGVMEDPILWDDLMKVTDRNYQISSLVYNLVDQEFLDSYGNRLKYDRQGNPTVQSLMEIPEVRLMMGVGKEEALANLAKQFKAGEYSYEEAIERVGAFNRNSNFSEKYFGTITEITHGKDKGKFRFEIVENTVENRRAFEDFITQRTFRDKLLYALAKAGVKVEFLDRVVADSSDVSGMYNTKTYERYFDTLVGVIKILAKENNNTILLSEEAGHLLVGIAENNEKSSVLMNRMMNYIKELTSDGRKNVVKAILMEDAKLTEETVDGMLRDMENDPNILREVAGRIIAAQLAGFNVSVDTKPDHSTLKAVANKVAGAAVSFGLASLAASPWVAGLVAIPGGIAGLKALGNLGKKVLRSMGSILFSVGKSLGLSPTMLKHIPGTILETVKQTSRDPETNELVTTSTQIAYHNLQQINAKDAIRREAREIARRFMNGQLGDVEDALKTQEERHHESSTEKRAASRLANSFKTFLQLMKNSGISKKVGLKLEAYLQDAIEGRRVFSNTAKQMREQLPDNPDVADALENRGSFAFISSMLDNIVDIIRQMEEMQLEELRGGHFKEMLEGEHMDSVATLSFKVRNISQLLSLVRLCNEAVTLMRDLEQSNSEFVKDFGIVEKREAIENMIKDIAKEVQSFNKLVFKYSLATVNGGRCYIDRFERMGWGKVEGREGRDKIFFDELLAGEDVDGHPVVEDASWWGLYFQKMGSSISVINQLVSNLYDYNKATANKEIYRYSQMLLGLHERIKQTLGHEDTSFMCEVSSNGELTGAIVQPGYRWGEWENAFDEWKKQTYKELKEKYADELSEMNEFEKSKWLHDKMIPLIEDWHKENSERRKKDEVNELFDDTGFDVEGFAIRYRPNDKYKSDQWDKLSFQQKQFVKEYIRIKQSLDQFILEFHPDSITSWRLPQFRGTTISRMRNPGNGVFRTIGDKFYETFFEDALDEESGDDSCYNNEEDSFFEKKNLTDRELARRVPIFGVNKLRDMRNLSRDVVMSTVHYAAMAINVRCLSTTATVLKNGIDVINETSINGVIEKTRGTTHSNNYDRYIKFLEMQVFGQRSKKVPFGRIGKRNFLLNKLMGFVNRISSWSLLAGKVASGTVNTGTGMLNVLKESLVGQHYTATELAKALLEYNKYALQGNIMEGLAPLNRSNKMYSFIRYFDVLNKNDEYFRNFTSHMQLNRWSQLRKLNYAMWVYESGNHLMQTLPYIARGMHTKLYVLKEGLLEHANDLTEEDLQNPDNFEEVGSVWDIFDEGQLQRGKNVEKYRKKAEADGQEGYYNEQPDIINGPEGANDRWGNPFRPDPGEGSHFYVRESDGFTKWDETAQSRFQTQCRYMTDNMHGIYNNADAVGFQQSVLGSAVLTMKKYLLGYADKLYLTDRYSAAEKQQVEGSAITFFKMLRWYGLGNGSNSMRWRMILMGIPIAMSVVCSLGNFQLGDILFKSLYWMASKYGLNRRGRRLLMQDGFSEYQIYNLKRFDTEVKSAIVLQTIAHLLSAGLVPHDNDEDDEGKEVEWYEPEWGEEWDAKILESLGYEGYLQDVENAITDDKGQVKKTAKKPGILYAKFSGYDKTPEEIDNALYWSGMVYYFMHRWEIEQNTLFPFSANMETSNEVKTQIGSLTNLQPVSISRGTWMINAVGHLINGEKSEPKFKRKTDVETWKQLWDDTPGWFDPKGQVEWMRTGEYLFAGENKFRREFFEFWPYLNSLNVAGDWYKGAGNYDFGRTMTTH